jgi:DNA-binding CsgD family transcriptional regulator/tetratricopeptide (TPR) repeat protein
MAPAAGHRPPQAGGLAARRHTGPMAARVTSDRLIGRQDELAELRAALGAAAAGRPSLALVAGESGVGKTRLVRELATHAREMGAQVLCGESIELGEGELPYGPLLGALRPLVRDGDDVLDALPESAREALVRLLPGLGGDGGPPAADGAAQAQVFEALLTLLDALGERAPVVLTLEDLHWADRSTRAFLAFLARGLDRERVLVIATYRSDELHRRHPLRPLLAELRHVRRVELAPLTPDQLAAAIGDILGEQPDVDLVARLHARSEGNPLFMEELLAAGGDGRGTLPPTLRDALMVRFERVGEAAQEVLRLLAVAHRPEHALLARASGLDAQALRDALRETVAAHLVTASPDESYAFRHALQREVVQDDLLPGERADLHARIADALEAGAAEGTPGHLVRSAIAHHRLGAGDRPAALRASVAAAHAAECVHAYGEAATLYERALELSARVPEADAPAGIDRVELLERAADAHRLADDRPRAEALLQAALHTLSELDDPLRTATVLRMLSRIQWTMTRNNDALETMHRALAVLPAGEPSPERAAVLGWLSKARMLQGRYRESLRAGEEALAVAETVGDDVARMRARDPLGVSMMALGDVEAGGAMLREAIAEAAQLDRPEELATTYTNLADALHVAGRSQEARAAAQEGLVAVEGKIAHHREWLALQLGEIAFDLGDWETTAGTIAEHGERRFTGSLVLHLLLRTAELSLGRGDHARAAEVLTRAAEAAEGTSEPQMHAPLGALLAELRRREGDLDAGRAAVEDALDRIEFCTEDVMRIARVSAAGVTVEADRAQRARDLGEPEAERDAITAAELLLARVSAAAEEGRPVEIAWRATANADVARARGQNDPGAWADAARAWDELERPYQAALARWREAEAHVGAGDRETAAATARTALEAARSLGAGWLEGELEGLVARGRLRLAEGDEGPGNTAAGGPATEEADDPFGLTPRERQVLALVARGATNREIGATLFMAEKTASVHVSRILAKLDVRTRTQAAAVAHRLGLED